MGKIYYDNQGSPWVDINNDTYPDFECLDAECNELDYEGADNPVQGDIGAPGPGAPGGGTPGGGFPGPGDDSSETRKDIELWSGIFSGILDGVKELLKMGADQAFEKSLNDAKKDIDQGKEGMAKYGEQVGINTGLLSENNALITEKGGLLSLVSSAINGQLSSLANLSESLSGLNGQLYNQTLALESAQARLDQAMNRANYPLGMAGLQKQRADIRSANYDVMTNGLAVNETNYQISNTQEAYNTVGSQLNQNLSTASGLRSDITTAYGQSQKFNEAINGAVAGYNQSAQQVGQGVRGIGDAVNTRQDYTQNVLFPMAEGSAGIRGGGQIAGAMVEGKYGEATGIALAKGIEGYVRNGGPVELGASQALIGSASIGIGKAVDSNLRAGVDLRQGSLNIIQEVGQATLRTTDVVNVIRQVDTAYTVATNKNNPDRIYDGAQVLSPAIGKIASIGGTYVNTATALVPGLQPISMPLNVATGALPALSQGAFQTLTEGANKLVTSGVSGSVGNYPSRPIGRDLVNRPNGGTASLPTIVGGGVILTLTGGARGMTEGRLTGNNMSGWTAGAINSLATTGTLKATIPPGTVRIGGD